MTQWNLHRGQTFSSHWLWIGWFGKRLSVAEVFLALLLEKMFTIFFSFLAVLCTVTALNDCEKETELYTWANNIVMWYWSSDTLFWQVPVDQCNMDIQYQRITRLHVSVILLVGVLPPCCASLLCLHACLQYYYPYTCKPSWWKKKTIHGFSFLSYKSILLYLADTWAAGAPL